MKHWVISAALAGSLVIGCKHHDEETHAKIATADVPAAVRTAFEKDHPGAKIGEVEMETYKDGTIHYEFEYTDTAGKKHDVEYSAAGEKLDKH